MDSTSSSWPVACPTRKISAMTGKACTRPWEPNLQQKDATISVGGRYQGEFGQKLYAWQKKLEKESSQVDKGTRSVVHESSKEFGRVLHEQLQEFAMILTKKYHYYFPAKFFEDYRGSFNKEDFLEMEQPRQELIHLNVPNEGWQERNEGSSQIADFSSSQGKFLANYNLDSSSIHQQQIQSGEDFLKPIVAGEKLKEAAKEVKGFFKGNKTPPVVLVLSLVCKSKCLSITLKDKQMDGEPVSRPSVFKTTHNEDDEKGETYVVPGWLSEFRNDRHLKAVGLQISAATCDKERLNSLYAFDVDTLTGFGIILDPHTMGTSNLNLVAIANPREIVCYSLGEDAALSAMIIIFVSIENLKMRKNRLRRRKKERKMNQIEKVGIG